MDKMTLPRDYTAAFSSMWKLKKKLFPRPKETALAKRDKAGNLITAPECKARVTKNY